VSGSGVTARLDISTSKCGDRSETREGTVGRIRRSVSLDRLRVLSRTTSNANLEGVGLSANHEHLALGLEPWMSFAPTQSHQTDVVFELLHSLSLVTLTYDKCNTGVKWLVR
jgi:hypothetical protein